MPRDTYDLPADLDQLLRMPVYPGIIPEESRPLREFLRRYHLPFASIAFNVRLGAGDAVPLGVDAAVKKAWESVTKLRIDAIATTHGGEATLIEVKQVVGGEAIWQILAYRDAYVEEHRDVPVRLILVGEAATAAARVLAQQGGVALYLFEFPPGYVDISAPAVTERAREL